MKIGVMYGNPETTTGGNALKFYASVRLDIRKTGVVKDGDTAIGAKTRVKVVKNKVAPPFRETEFEIMYGIGVNWAGELLDLGAEAGVIEKSGAYYSWKGDRIGQGRENASRWLVENPKAAEEIRALLVARRKAENARLGLGAAPGAEDAAAA
jgi:recombination protein RecA